MYSPNPQRHHLVLFHREKRQYNISKSAFFFSQVTCSVCPICRAVGRERKDIQYCVFMFFFSPKTGQSMMLEERGMNAKRNRHASLNMI